MPSHEEVRVRVKSLINVIPRTGFPRRDFTPQSFFKAFEISQMQQFGQFMGFIQDNFNQAQNIKNDSSVNFDDHDQNSNQSNLNDHALRHQHFVEESGDDF